MISGECVGPGYLNAAPARQASFSRQDGQATYATGDIGLFDGTWYYFLGRKDGEVKIQGHRIDLHEIERFLRDRNLVADVVVEPHWRKGNAEAIQACVILNATCELSQLGHAMQAHFPRGQSRVTGTAPPAPYSITTANWIVQLPANWLWKTEKNMFSSQIKPLFERLKDQSTATALINEQGTYSFAELGVRTAAIAQVLAPWAGRNVLVHGHKQLDAVAAMLACISQGCCFSFTDQSNPVPRIEKIARLTRAELILTATPQRLEGLDRWPQWVTSTLKMATRDHCHSNLN